MSDIDSEKVAEVIESITSILALSQMPLPDHLVIDSMRSCLKENGKLLVGVYETAVGENPWSDQMDLFD